MKLGLVASLNRPGGNLTGDADFNVEIAPKRLELLHEFLPTARSIALLVNPANPTEAAAQTEELQGAADALGVRLTVANASSAIELEDAFATLVRDQVEALQLGVDPLFGNHIDQIVALATWCLDRDRGPRQRAGHQGHCSPAEDRADTGRVGGCAERAARPVAAPYPDP